MKQEEIVGIRVRKHTKDRLRKLAISNEESDDGILTRLLARTDQTSKKKTSVY
jgi:hypothetical protein